MQSGRFGACLMAEPELVADGVGAMRRAVSVPVTAKCRIGIDDQDEDEALENFVTTVREAGCTTFIVHARKAWLEGLSPKQNRDVPPLNYDRVYRLKQSHPDLHIVINGGIGTLDAADEHLARVDGVMLGRAAYQSPFILAEVDRRYFGATDAPPSREDIVERLIPYIATRLAAGARLNQITRHILGLYQGVPGAKQWRRHLSQNAHLEGAGPQGRPRCPRPGARRRGDCVPARSAGARAVLKDLWRCLVPFVECGVVRTVGRIDHAEPGGRTAPP